jgi:hypothetical protein
MLVEAKKEIGFQYAGERIVAEIFDSRDGGCEIFISCLSGDKRMYKDTGEEALLSKLKLQNQAFCFEEMLKKSSRLRIDTHKDNLPMQRALAKFGFSYAGIIYIESGAERLAYEIEMK